MTTSEKTQSGCLVWVVTAIFVILLGGIVLMLIGSRMVIHAVMVGETGPVETSDKWPDPLKKLIDGRPDIATETIQVYQLCQGFDPEYVWRIDAPSELRGYVVENWELTQVPAPYLPTVFNGRSQLSGVATPDWWQPSSLPDIEYYVCPRTLAGEKSDRFQVAYSETAQVLYVHYWFNF